MAELRQCQAEPSEPPTLGVLSCEDGECTDTHLADIDTPAQQVLAEQICGSAEAITRVDMSEMMERHSVSKLLGSPPGAPALPPLPVGSCVEFPLHSQSCVLLWELDCSLKQCKLQANTWSRRACTSFLSGPPNQLGLFSSTCLQASSVSARAAA